MKRILLFGNSGSGKSTLARQLAEMEGLAHLDLDILAWLPTVPPKRAPLAETRKRIQEFMRANESRVIEGCYTDLLEIAGEEADEIVFLNLDIEQCVENARARLWEPHKYESREAQDANLEMLVTWIRQYRKRDDTYTFL